MRMEANWRSMNTHSKGNESNFHIGLIHTRFMCCIYLCLALYLASDKLECILFILVGISIGATEMYAYCKKHVVSNLTKFIIRQNEVIKHLSAKLEQYAFEKIQKRSMPN